jgi:hypothetical protein
MRTERLVDVVTLFEGVLLVVMRAMVALLPAPAPDPPPSPQSRGVD